MARLTLGWRIDKAERETQNFSSSLLLFVFQVPNFFTYRFPDRVRTILTISKIDNELSTLITFIM